ncbi:hypothetical protein I2750_21680, partial [Bacillus sp. PR5]|nr:hypothetical protein [Bacillus sp. PR5]
TGRTAADAAGPAQARPIGADGRSALRSLASRRTSGSRSSVCVGIWACSSVG